MSTRQIAIIGGGWAGLASAVAACQLGAEVSLFEMAGQLGGRARSLPGDALTPGLDNGQHILIGAYTHSLKLMAALGVDIDQAFLRTPLRLRYPRHEGLRLPPGPPLISFARGVWAHPSWPAKARLQLLLAASTWLARGFNADASLSVSALCAGLPKCVRQDLIEPLCVAALNTSAGQASAQVFLRVLRDALFSGVGSADLLLPRQGLSALMATPAMKHLSAQGVHIHLGTRVQTLAAEGSAWRLNEHRFDQVILACSSSEAARLTQNLAPGWSAMAQSLQFEPIITVYIRSPASALPAPMVALQEGPEAPAQFVFDLGQLGTQPGLFAWVISGASAWVARGLDETAKQTLAQAQKEFDWASPPEVLRVLAEKRATFACTPGLQRPPMHIAPGLLAAGDYVDGPYPATLEGAVRAGQAAASALG